MTADAPELPPAQSPVTAKLSLTDSIKALMQSGRRPY
jgi:hypothetical protein